MVKYSKKRNLNNRKVTRRNSKKRNNLKKNTRNRKVSKKGGGAAENTPGQLDYDDFFEFLICIKENPKLLNQDYPRSESGTQCVQKKHLSLRHFKGLELYELRELFNHYVEFCYVVSENLKTITITSRVTKGLIYYNKNKNKNYERFGFNGVNNNNYTVIKAFENTNEGKQALFEYFQGKYLQDAKDLGIKK